MLPQKPYRPSYKKFGLLPRQKESKAEDVPVTVQTFTFYTLLAPLMKTKKETLETDVPSNNNKSQAQ